MYYRILRPHRDADILFRIKFNAEAFEWWEIFAHVKGLAIWISSSHEYATGLNKDPLLLFSGWFCTERHNRIVTEKFARMIGAE